jgi:hypothetical protein
MEKLTLASVSLADLHRLIHLQEHPVAAYYWTQVDSVSLDQSEQQQVATIVAKNHDRLLILMNEATIWARAIFPLLMLAEQAQIQAWAGVELSAQYRHFQLEGIADGVLGYGVAGRVTAPYLVVLEAKRGVDAPNPIYQLYAELLAAAYQNWQQNYQELQEIFGCYTIADSWQFVRAEVTGFEADRPTLRVEFSREYAEKLEATTILKILKQIVAKYRHANDSAIDEVKL